MTRTKIICTIGPSVNTLDKILALIHSGMNVARLNFSHGTHGDHLQTILLLKQAREMLSVPLAIMLDTKGPEIRLGKITSDVVYLEPNQKWLLSKQPIEGNSSRVYITPPGVLEKLAIGQAVYFDDGYITSHVLEHTSDGVLVQIENGGIAHSGKGVNIPNAKLDLPSLTDKDIADIRFGCQHNIDIIAASFVRSADDVIQIKKLLEAAQKPEILVLAKIENPEGVNNFDAILQVADGIMVARGDLGVEVPLSQVPRLQKMMIRKCYLMGKPSVTATQMLESMIHNPRPTRAEASDVANAIYDSTDAVMLSGETAVGKYPLQTVQVMKSIVEEAEADFNYRTFFENYESLLSHDLSCSICLATAKTALNSQAQAIFAFTNSGGTARLLAAIRPPIPIIAMTSKAHCFHQLALSWGVTPILGEECATVIEASAKLSAIALEKGMVQYGDVVVVTAGSPFGISGTTNMMIVDHIGDILVRGYKGIGARVHGKVAVVLEPKKVTPYKVKGKMLVLSRCDDSYLPFIQEAAGIILDSHVDDAISEKYVLEIAEKLNKPALVRASNACRILREGHFVTLDPQNGLIYSKIVEETI